MSEQSEPKTFFWHEILLKGQKNQFVSLLLALLAFKPILTRQRGAMKSWNLLQMRSANSKYCG